MSLPDSLSITGVATDGSNPGPDHASGDSRSADGSGQLSERLRSIRVNVLELMLLTQTTERTDEAHCAGILQDLIDIAECWIENGLDNPASRVGDVLDFAESGAASLKHALSDEIPDAAASERIRDQAQRQWGEYLSLLNSDERAGDGDRNPWVQVLQSSEPENASEETNAPAVPPDVAALLVALATQPTPANAAEEPKEPAAPSPAPIVLSTSTPPAPRAIFESAATTPGDGAPRPPMPPPTARLELDAELRAAFVEDTERGVSLIEQTLLNLESDPSNAESLHVICRALHTMKGASASVGLSDLAHYLHDLEDFVQLSGPGKGLDIEPMLQAVDALRAQMDAFAGKQAPVAPAPEPPEKAGPVPVVTAAEPEPNAAAATPARAVVSKSPAPRASEESIRVEAARLDRLMDLLSELVISRNRRDTQVGRLKQLHAELIRVVGRLRLFGETFGSGPHADTPCVESGGAARAKDVSPFASSHQSDVASEIVNDVAEIARSMRELYEPVMDENQATSRLMGQFRHELMELRRLPLSGLFLRLQRAARDAARLEGRQVHIELRNEHTGLEPSLQERLYEPLLHLVRNAVSHGVEREVDRVAAGKAPVGTVTIETRGDPTSVVVEVRDDGKGLDYDAIQRKGMELGLLDRDRAASQSQLAQLIFHPGFSTRQQVSEVSGRGVGLDVVASVADRLRGQIEVESSTGKGTTVRLRIPLRSSIEHTMVFRVDGHLFALPMQYVQAARPTGHGHERTQLAHPGAFSGASNAKHPIDSARANQPSLRMRDILSLDSTPRPAEEHALVLSHGSQTVGRVELLVDAVVGPEEVVVRSLPSFFRRNRILGGVTLSGAGEIVILLDGRELIDEANAAKPPLEGAGHAQGTPAPGRPAAAPLKVLVVDDSVSVRRSLTRMLERRGCIVTEAADGLEALDVLRTFSFSLVVTDLEMPRLGGMELLAEIRRSRRTRQLSVAIVTSVNSNEMRERARALGVNDYISKPITDATVAQLLASVRSDGASE
jgi:chemosensory pili system protein ChpA (sensor histidine kinase/response regulator)